MLFLLVVRNGHNPRNKRPKTLQSGMCQQSLWGLWVVPVLCQVGKPRGGGVSQELLFFFILWVIFFIGKVPRRACGQGAPLVPGSLKRAVPGTTPRPPPPGTGPECWSVPIQKLIVNIKAHFANTEANCSNTEASCHNTETNCPNKRSLMIE